MTSRLDRLLLLLDSGSSSSTRKAAAQQLGQIQKLHPHELSSLLRSVHVYLRSSSWDTRIAAGQAVEAIAGNVSPWHPIASKGVCTSAESTEISAESHHGDAAQSGRLDFKTFNVKYLLKHAQPLLASARTSTEYDVPSLANDPTFAGLNRKEQAARLRQQVLKRLGMQGFSSASNVQELIDDEDFMQDPHPKSTDDAYATACEVGDLTNLSQRERHRAKRKAKLLARQSSSGIDSNTSSGPSEGPAAKRVCQPGDLTVPATAMAAATAMTDKVPCSDNQQGNGATTETEHVPPEESLEWPFESICDDLCRDLFHPSWTIRHGAATGLREILKLHGSTAGLHIDVPTDKWVTTNLAWLEDMALRLISVLVLDRFGDYISDEVICPVRETSAQSLGVVLRHLDAESVSQVLKVLLQMLNEDTWEVRHGGLLAIKYLMLVRQEVVSDVLVTAWPCLLSGLSDISEDVRAVAASALLPVVPQFIQLLPQNVGKLLETLWEALLELDDLTSSTHNVMVLLSALMEACDSKADAGIDAKLSLQVLSDMKSEDKVAPFDLTTLSTPLPDLLTRCFAFLRHPSKVVRQSTLQTMQTLLVLLKPVEASIVKQESVTDGDFRQVLSPLMCHLFQTMLLDGESDIHDEVQKTWQSCLSRAPTDVLCQLTLQQLPNWMCLWLSSTSVPLDTNLLLLTSASSQPQQHGGKPCTDDNITPASLFIGGLLGTEQTYEQDQAACVVRLHIATLFAMLAHSLQQDGSGAAATAFTAIQNLLQSLILSNSGVSRWSAACFITAWAKLSPPTLDSAVHSHLLSLASISAPPVYDELTSHHNTLQSECKRLLAALGSAGIPVGEQPSVYTAETAAQFASTAISVCSQYQHADAVQAQQSVAPNVLAAAGHYQKLAQALHARVQVCVASSLVYLGTLPDKLNPVIRPTMDTIKQETNPLFKLVAMDTLYMLLQHCAARSPSPNPKVLRNLVTMVTRDQLHTPSVTSPFTPYMTLATRYVAGGGGAGFLTPSALHTPASAATPSALSSAAGHDKTGGMFPTAEVSCDQYDGILTLSVHQLVSSAVPSRRSRAMTSPVHAITMATTAISSSVAVEPLQLNSLLLSDDPVDQVILQRVGSLQALQHLCVKFDARLAKMLPVYWDLMTSSLLKITAPLAQDRSSDEDLLKVTTALQLCELSIPHLPPSLLKEVEGVLSCVFNCLVSVYTAVRHLAARVIAAMASRSLSLVMQALIDRVSLLSNNQVAAFRCGLIEAIIHIVDVVRLAIVPYVVLLIVPVLSRMSDQHTAVRLTASQCFATLIRFLPLESGVTSPPDMSAELVARRNEERHFLEQLLDGKRVDDFKLPVAVNAELRAYQQDGVNWLAFLRKYNLHGILCDDMGLGKTLQTICIVLADHHLQRQQHAAHQECQQGTKTRDDNQGVHVASCEMPSLVVCPPTLTGHWCAEIAKFCGEDGLLKVLHYMGDVRERTKMRTALPDYNLVVSSYDIVRNDVDFFKSVHWNYCVLDEGHIIKSNKTKITRAVKSLQASHRLILSGTPIQNNVSELWSLFDFLMPGFLGSERQFLLRYGRPIINSRDAKASSKEQEAGVLAMESLHRQVLPFILRRMKEDVLQDLPPKIIQDYYCQLSPLQVRLYEEFSVSQSKESISKSLQDQSQLDDDDGETGKRVTANAASASGGSSTHIFQALQYLQKVCNHPSLVLTSKHPSYSDITAELSANKSSLHDIKHACKLTALKQLLLDCGLGHGSSSFDALGTSSAAASTANGSADILDTDVVSAHRVLLFCQQKSVLNIVEKDLLKHHLPSITFLRLDGNTPATERQGLVTRFNNDPSIDMLLLTTHVGGLGLNLTGADTVIFLEHDWNPMKDLQAMDRAHRIGQKKVVNVYRLVTRGTMEEKIMGLQKFKLGIANSVVTADNSSLSSMDTHQLLDLFQVEDKTSKSSGAAEKPSSVSLASANVPSSTGAGTSLKGVLEDLDELWSAQDYQEEYNVDAFVQSLSKQ